MSHTITATTTHTYTIIDIEKVIRRFAADLAMIAQSTGAMTEADAAKYAHDVELLAKNGYLKEVDVTLLSGTLEIRAVQYVVSASAGDLTTSRPGGVLWPKVWNPQLRITIIKTTSFTTDAAQALSSTLKFNWMPSDTDTSHATLGSSGGRDYASRGWGMQRKDYQ